MYQRVKTTIKLLEENTEANLYDLGFVKGFLDMTLKAWATKENIAKVDIIKF